LSFLYIFGYTLKTKYKNLENFINLFPSLLVIKVQIFNHPFCIFGYTLKTKYENLAIFKEKFPSLFMLKFKSLNHPFLFLATCWKPNIKIWQFFFPVTWVIIDLQSYLIFEFWILSFRWDFANKKRSAPHQYFFFHFCDVAEVAKMHQTFQSNLTTINH
jgi:hypothetical protein